MSLPMSCFGVSVGSPGQTAIIGGICEAHKGHNYETLFFLGGGGGEQQEPLCWGQGLLDVTKTEGRV